VAVLVGGAAAVTYLAAERADAAVGVLVIAKPLPVLCLAAWTLGRRTPYARTIGAGLFASAAGDVLLELGSSWFLSGLLAFLCAHACYAVAFWRDGRSLRLLRLLPFLSYGAAVYGVLMPSLGAMAPPVGAYVVAIVVMMWRAAARDDGSFAGRMATLGAVLFGLSDTLIAFDRFLAPIPGVAAPIILLYWAGQLGIALSAIGRRLAPGALSATRGARAAG
jgi:uncharacterized membrane protein YhhN